MFEDMPDDVVGELTRAMQSERLQGGRQRTMGLRLGHVHTEPETVSQSGPITVATDPNNLYELTLLSKAEHTSGERLGREVLGARAGE